MFWILILGWYVFCLIYVKDNVASRLHYSNQEYGWVRLSKPDSLYVYQRGKIQGFLVILVLTLSVSEAWGILLTLKIACSLLDHIFQLCLHLFCITLLIVSQRRWKGYWACWINLGFCLFHLHRYSPSLFREKYVVFIPIKNMLFLH